jgi:hypothetical protein
MGIYADNGYGYPGSLILDAGAGIDGTSQTVQDITISQALDAGLYWIGAVSQVATCTTRQWSSRTVVVPMRIGTSAPSAGASGTSGFSEAAVTGSLPATFTNAPTQSTGGTRAHVKIG